MLLLLELNLLTVCVSLFALMVTFNLLQTVLCTFRHQEFAVYNDIIFRSTLKRFVGARLQVT